MRVVFCVDNLNIGGTELNAVRTAERLASEVELRLIALNGGGPLAGRYAALGLPPISWPIRNLYGVRTAARGMALARWLRAERIDVVHTHDFYSNVFAGTWGRLAGCAVVMSRRWWKEPRLAHRLIGRASYRFAHRVLANSERIGGLLQSEGVPAGRVRVVRNFVEPEAFTAPPAGWTDVLRRELRIAPTSPVVGMVASLSPIKNHAMLIRAAARLAESFPQLVVVLIGADNGSRERLEVEAARCGVAERMRFAGLRPSRPNLHRLFDVSVLTSWSEGLPNAILEAMAAERPVVATAVGAVPDCVEEEVTGYLVPADDDAALADRLGRLLADERLRARMGGHGLEAAVRRYSPDVAVSGLTTLYEEALGAAGRRIATRATGPLTAVGGAR